MSKIHMYFGDLNTNINVYIIFGVNHQNKADAQIWLQIKKETCKYFTFFIHSLIRFVRLSSFFFASALNQVSYQIHSFTRLSRNLPVLP